MTRNRGLSRQILYLTGLCVILLLSSAVACCCCPISVPLDNYGGGDVETSSLEGTCYISSDDGKTPAFNQVVEIDGRMTKTDEDGQFEITGIAGGTHQIRISSSEFMWNSSVKIPAGEALDLGDITMHPVE